MPGFTYYNEIPVETPPTIAELVADLSGEQRGAVLNGYAHRVKAITLARRALIDEDVVERLYRKLDSIEDYAAKLMRGEVLVTPAEYDAEGNLISEAQYNEPVTTPTGLINGVSAEFVEDFNSTHIEAILTRMVEFSKHDGTGTWTFYKTEVNK